MANCPNCGLSTMRTKDWACQWCGYPLVSGMYGKTSKTFAELKQEREGAAIGTALLVETEPTVEPEPETNQVTEIKVEPEPEPETSQVVEPEVESAPEPDEDQVVKVEAAAAPEPAKAEEPEPSADEEIQPIPEVTVAELCSSYQGYGMAGHDKFKNSVFRVSGIVDSVVTKDVVDQYRVALTDEEPHPLGDIYCKFERKDAAELHKLAAGQPLTVQGKYDGFVTNIVLTDCVLINQ
jgi:hypothetical protein